MNKFYISQLISTHISFTKNMSNPKPGFPTLIKTNISSITKHLINIGSSNKHNTNQNRITFHPDISKTHLLNFLHSMYHKLSNQSSLNFKKCRENFNKFLYIIAKNTFTSSKILQINLLILLFLIKV